jgi:hypothetical protein
LGEEYEKEKLMIFLVDRSKKTERFGWRVEGA